MSKIYVCSKNCGSIEETDGGKEPVCCGTAMKELKENELFGCSGCAGCRGGGCGADGGNNTENEGKEDKSEE